MCVVGQRPEEQNQIVGGELPGGKPLQIQIRLYLAVELLRSPVALVKRYDLFVR